MGPLCCATPTMFVRMPCRALGQNEKCIVPSRPQRQVEQVWTQGTGALSAHVSAVGARESLSEILRV